jgi:multiple antibiotic resistance protein
LWDAYNPGDIVIDLASAFVTLFVVLDPPGMAPIFLGLTAGMPAAIKRGIAIEACVIAFLLLAGATLFGTWLLGVLGISLPAFRIAGGLLLFSIAFEMVFERRQRRKADDATQQPDTNIAAFPLAIPLLAGPGAITACVLLAGRSGGNLIQLGLLIGTIALILLMTMAVLIGSHLLERALGPRGLAVSERLLGVLLAALAVQYVADGVLALRG